MHDDDSLYTPRETANKLNSNERTLERWRTQGTGPAYVKIGRRVAYTHSAIREFIQQHTRRHTAEKK
jgi:predicted DNA-binding transcriptional regulator AlpA